MQSYRKGTWEAIAKQAGFSEGGNEYRHGWVDNNGDIHPTAFIACRANGITKPDLSHLPSVEKEFGRAVDLPLNAICYELFRDLPKLPELDSAIRAVLAECSKYRETHLYGDPDVRSSVRRWLQVSAEQRRILDV